MKPMIKSLMKENRKFKPTRAFLDQADFSNLKEWKQLSKEGEKNPEKFWANRAKEIHWFKPFKKVLDWKPPYVKWFVGGKTNASFNCLDIHLISERRNKAAIIWEGEPGEVRTLTYLQLSIEVNRLANALKKYGVHKGDVVGIYMGMVPEAMVAMLACARIGATHNVVFGGFSGEALRDRLNDSQAVLLITQDGVYRRGQAAPLKANIDAALEAVPTLKSVIVLQRTKQETFMKPNRDVFWSEALEGCGDECPAEPLDSEHPLFILYTSGSTGKPKGILHSTGGYLTQVKFTSKLVFDLREQDIYFCTADIGWITGHSYVTYGPLMNGASVFLYEGAPMHPGPDRFWSMIAKHKVSIFYTAPTAIRAFMKAGDEFPKKHNLSSLRLLGSVGEPINPEAWMWYHNLIGGKRCPIVDTWWQTETGAIMISPVPAFTATKPGTATLPLPGIQAAVVHKDGRECKANEGGYLVVKHPWPSQLRTVYGDNARYENTYYSEFPAKGKFKGYYFTGDGARRDKDGYFWIMGRVDDVVNVSGHRLGTAEVESALVSHRFVAEAAVVARPDDIKGSALVAFVVLRTDASVTPEEFPAVVIELKNWVAKEIGPIAKPDDIRITNGLPKTRSGKIMRRLLRELVTNGKTSGDVTTLEDISVIEALRRPEDDE